VQCTIQIIDDIVTETTTEDEDGTKRVSKAFTKEGLGYAMARINIRYKTLRSLIEAITRLGVDPTLRAQCRPCVWRE
jgi:hypothetical protein